MKRKWSYFLAGALLAAYILLSNGAPLLPIAAGIGGAALFMRRAGSNQVVYRTDRKN